MPGPHPGAIEVIRALEALGARIRDDWVYVECRSCHRIRKFTHSGVAHLRVVSLLFCLQCIKALQLATANKSEIII